MENQLLLRSCDKKLIAFFALISIPVFFCGVPNVQAQENMYSYSIQVYNHDTGEPLGFISTEMVHIDNMYKAIVEGVQAPPIVIGSPMLGGEVGIVTTSTTSRVEFDIDDKRVYVYVSGQENTRGEFALFVSPGLVTSPENVEVYLDNQLIESIVKTIPENSSEPSWVVIYAEYTHSTHILMFQLTPEVSKPWYTRPLNLALIVVVIVIVALGAIYWFKFRR